MEITNTLKKAKWSPVANYNGFEEAFNNLQYKHTFYVRREIIKRLKWSPRTYNYKRLGETPLRENEIPVIQEIFERYGINPWTGEKL